MGDDEKDRRCVHKVVIEGHNLPCLAMIVSNFISFSVSISPIPSTIMSVHTPQYKLPPNEQSVVAQRCNTHNPRHGHATTNHY